LATASVLLFVVLDLAVTWSDYAGLISLAATHQTATSDPQRAAYASAVDYASIASVAGPLVASALNAAIIVACVLIAIWVLLVSYRLVRSAKQGWLSP
jgi:hypothetical protein